MKQKTSFSLALVAVLTTIFLVWYGQRPIAPKQATWDDVVAEAKSGGYRIITTEALAERYFKTPSDLMLIDTRQEWEYHTGHIKGAHHFSMEPTWWARWHKSDDLATFLGPDKARTLLFY
ncbi:MAG: rhodanese-like domain-containing protein [Desulfosarcina sp.]